MNKIAIDVMGGDFGSKPILEGVVKAFNEKPFFPILVGNKEEIIKTLPKDMLEKVEIVESNDTISMSDNATDALRRKESSIYKAVELVRNKKAVAVVSAGHSGATMTLATLRIGRLPNISKPALATLMPTSKGTHTLVLDVGAVTDCTPKNLFEFAIMGEAYAKKILDISSPVIGLISNGSEDSKGNALTKEAFKLLKKLDGFSGNVEGKNLFDGSTNIVVCDGFTGNILLKTSESAVTTIFSIMKYYINNSFIAKIGALLMKKSVFLKIKKRVDYAEYGGAPLLGINGCAIVSHGSSNSKAIKNAIFQAIDYTDKKVNSSIEERIKETLY